MIALASLLQLESLIKQSFNPATSFNDYHLHERIGIKRN
jgi:hypothetical protein